MGWVRLDDSFPDHPKAVQAGPTACWMYICGIAYANRFLTDGFIPERQVARLCDAKKPETLAAMLVEVGLWEPTTGGYLIHDYLDYQSSAEKVKRERSSNARRQAEWKEKNGGSNGVTNDSDNGASNGVTNGPVTPAPINTPNKHPSGVGAHAPDPPPSGQKRDGRKARIPEEFGMTESTKAWCQEQGYDRRLVERELEKFRNHFAANGEAKLNWQRAFMNWLMACEDRGWGKVRADQRQAAVVP